MGSFADHALLTTVLTTCETLASSKQHTGRYRYQIEFFNMHNLYNWWLYITMKSCTKVQTRAWSHLYNHLSPYIDGILRRQTLSGTINVGADTIPAVTATRPSTDLFYSTHMLYNWWLYIISKSCTKVQTRAWSYLYNHLSPYIDGILRGPRPLDNSAHHVWDIGK